MSEPTNEDRAFAAREALAAWRGPKGYDPGEATDEEDCIDLIADLLHMAWLAGHDTDAIIRMATMNFEEEREER